MYCESGVWWARREHLVAFTLGFDTSHLYICLLIPKAFHKTELKPAANSE